MDLGLLYQTQEEEDEEEEGIEQYGKIRMSRRKSASSPTDNKMASSEMAKAGWEYGTRPDLATSADEQAKANTGEDNNPAAEACRERAMERAKGQPTHLQRYRCRRSSRRCCWRCCRDKENNDHCPIREPGALKETRRRSEGRRKRWNRRR